MFKLFFIDRRSYITEMGKATVVISNAASGHDFGTDAYLIGLLRNRSPVHRFSRINTDFFVFLWKTLNRKAVYIIPGFGTSSKKIYVICGELKQ